MNVTPTFSAPLGNLVDAAVKYRNSDKISMQRGYAPYIDGGRLLIAAGASFNDAMRQGIKLSRRSPTDEAHVLLRSLEGVYYLAPLNTIVPWFPGAGVEVDLRIDGTVHEPLNGMRKPNIEAASARKLHPDVQGIVGAYSWIDLRTSGTGARTRFPRLSA